MTQINDRIYNIIPHNLTTLFKRFLIKSVKQFIGAMKREIFHILRSIMRNKQVKNRRIKKSFIVIANEINYANLFAYCADRNQHWCTFSGTLSRAEILHVCLNTDDCSFTYHCIRYDILDRLRIHWASIKCP